MQLNIRVYWLIFANKLDFWALFCYNEMVTSPFLEPSMSLIHPVCSSSAHVDETPSGVAERTKLARILKSVPAPDGGIISYLLRVPTKRGGFWHVSFEMGLTDANFPTEMTPSLEGARCDEITVSLDVSLAELRSEGRRPGMGAETLLCGLMFCDDERRPCTIWGLGQLHEVSGSIGWLRSIELPSRSCGIMISVEYNEIHVTVMDISRCRKGHFVLSFPMTLDEIAQRDAEDVAAASQGADCS